MENIHESFVYNSMKANPGIFQFIILGNTGSDLLQINYITSPVTLVLLLIQN